MARIDPNTLNAIARRLREIPRPSRTAPGRRAPEQGFLAKITGHATLGANRWKYAWKEVRRNGDQVVDIADGRSGTTTENYAINLAEIGHTATLAWGVDMDGDDYPVGFAAMPIGGAGDGTHAYDVTVVMCQSIGTSGVSFDFCLMGSHDGTCEDEE